MIWKQPKPPKEVRREGPRMSGLHPEKLLLTTAGTDANSPFGRWPTAGGNRGQVGGGWQRGRETESGDIGHGGRKRGCREFQVSLTPKLAIPPSNTLTTQDPFKTHLSRLQITWGPPKCFRENGYHPWI